MKLALQIISWAMAVFGTLAAIDLIVQSDQGVTGNGAGIAVSIVWVVQSVLTLIYIHQTEVK